MYRGHGRLVYRQSRSQLLFKVHKQGYSRPLIVSTNTYKVSGEAVCTVSLLADPSEGRANGLCLSPLRSSGQANDCPSLSLGLSLFVRARNTVADAHRGGV